MTTTAHEDQFTTATQTIEPVRQLYDTAAILRRNVAELELALKQQMERAEAAEEKLTTAREDMQSWIDSRNGWMERAGAAEAELLAVREDNHSMMLEIDELRKELAATAPNVPTDEQIHAAYRNALGQSIRERDMPEIRKFARALLQSRAVKDSLTTQADCRACANRGRINGLSQESYCDSCVYEGRGWRQNHFADASKMVAASEEENEH